MDLTVKALIENVDTITEYVNERLKKMGCSVKSRTQIDIALDELFANVCNYAYGDEIGHVTVRVRELPDKNSVQISLEDKGMHFDPLAVKEPDITASIHERRIGGLGIFMVKKTMDDVYYEYRDGCNIITVVKTL